MTEEDPDLLAGDNLDRLRGRGPYSAMSERFRLTEELENAKYQNDLLAQKCRELEKENFDLAANQCHAGYGGEYGHHRCREIDRLTEERDEARREVCEIMHYTGYLCGDYANHRKWDCYKDDRNHPFSEEIKQNFKAWMDGQYELHAEEIKRLKDECVKSADEIERLRKENDDMRAIVSLQGEVVQMAQRRHEERDEARRRYCFAMAEHGEEAEARQNAEDEGWDCFKENNNDR